MQYLALWALLFAFPLFSFAQNQVSQFNKHLYESESATEKKPPISAVKITEQFLVGSVAGFISSLVFGGMGAGIEKAIEPQRSPYSGLGGAVVGGLIGVTIGSAWGVYKSGQTKKQTGSFAAALAGSLTSTLIFIAIYDNSIQDELLIVGLYGLPTVGGILGFSLSRRYRASATPMSGFINIDQGQLSISLPTIGVRPNPFRRNDVVQMVELVRLNM